MSLVNERVDELVARFSAPDACLADLLCDSHDPDAVAFTLIHEDFSRDTLTFGELRERSERVAAGLVELGVSSGDSVATLMGKSADYLATLVGIWRLGAAHVPLFTAFAPPAIAMRLDGSAAKVVVTDTSQRSKLDAVTDTTTGTTSGTPWSVVHLRSHAGADLAAGDVDFADLAAPGRSAPGAVAVGGRGAMVRMYTSGTTGRPKGVSIPVAAMATWQLYCEFGLDVSPDDVFWCAADPGWAYGLFAGVMAPLAAGRTSLLHEDKFTPDATWRIMSEQAVTNFAAAPTVYRSLRVAKPTSVVLQKLSSAGEPLTPEVNEWSREQLGLEVHDHFGQTELGMVFCNHHHPALHQSIRPGSMGVPLPGWRTAILRNDADEVATSGELGRVAVDMAASSTAWFDGYVDAPDATAEKFSADGRWYLTGDSGRVDDDGHYYFMARDDDVIIMAGYRIGPFDVESVMATHPAVQECAVIAVPDAMKGEVIEAFVALKEPVDDVDALIAELQQRVRDNLAAYAYPRAVHIVDNLPKTPSGKIQRFVLRQQRQAEITNASDG
jgi:acetyl-CoA synthetase